MRRHPSSSQLYNDLRLKLEAPSVPQLKTLVTSVGIEFEGGVDSLSDCQGRTVRDQVPLVLDEVEPQEILQALKTLLDVNI
jgi:hypothetical protein